MKSMIVLDVGCGAGSFSYNMFNNNIGSIILGIDQTEECIEKANSNLKESHRQFPMKEKLDKNWDQGIAFECATLDDVLVTGEREVK